MVRSIIEDPFKFQIVVAFELGGVYGACLTQQHTAIIFRTNQLLTLAEEEQKLKEQQLQNQKKELELKEKELLLKEEEQKLE